MAMKFEGKIAMITGGSTGMGLATARRFVKEGMDHFFITGRRKDSLAAAATDIGQNATAVQISGLPAEECSFSTDRLLPAPQFLRTVGASPRRVG
jgi:NADP-dependent 3-hydroxy acid dehydrogenase YdfG